VLVHGYPLNGNSWERQERVLLASRLYPRDHLRIARGFGRSSQPTVGYGLRHVRRRPQRAARASEARRLGSRGFSMCTGEVTRYLCNYGSGRVRKAALFGVIPPFLIRLTTTQRVWIGRCSRASSPRSSRTATATSKDFLDNFYNVDKLAPRAHQRASLAGQLQRRRRGPRPTPPTHASTRG